MKIFISWSGDESHKVALALREWLPSVIQSIDPYVSSEDIDKGTRWASDIANELDESAFGILCVTQQNLNAPWLNFEAGALGKSVDKSRVCPILFRIKRSEVSGPILQFQSTVIEREDVLKLLKSINEACGSDSIEESRLEKGFSVWWPSLDTELNKIPKPKSSVVKKEEPENPTEKMLEEILQLSRSNQMILRNPEELLPSKYLNHIVLETEEIRSQGAFKHPAIINVLRMYNKICRVSRDLPQEVRDTPELELILGMLKESEESIAYLESRSGRRRRRLFEDFNL